MSPLTRFGAVFLVVMLLVGHNAGADPYVPRPKRDFTGNLVQHATFDEPKQARGGGHADGFQPGTTEVTGWKVSGGTISILDMPSTPPMRTVVLGKNAAISQVIDLPPGRMYEVSFLVTCAPAGPPFRTGVVNIAGKTFPFRRQMIPPDEENDDNYWTLVQFEVAGTGKTVLEIRSTTDDPQQHGPNIADIIIVPRGFPQSAVLPTSDA